MAEKATIASLYEGQVKLAAKIDVMEEGVKEMVKVFCLLLGEDVPAKLRKIVKEWEAQEGKDDVTIKPASKVNQNKCNMSQCTACLFLEVGFKCEQGRC